MNLIEKEFCDTLDILTDFKKSRFLIAFSGGVDSLALLMLCLHYTNSINIVPVYVNHNLRNLEELNKEIELNISNCKKLGIDSLIIREIKKGEIKANSKCIGIEAAARKMRYEILEEERIRNNCDYILTAHHRDDQVETVLMKIISNAPITGLRGVSYSWNNTLRPLLEFQKKVLIDYVQNAGFNHCEDSTNRDNSIKRNEIRNVIIPQLKEQMPDFEDRILRIRSYALKQCQNVDSVNDRIAINQFNSYSQAQKILVLFEMWDNIIGTSMPQTLVNRVIEMCSENRVNRASSNGGLFYSFSGMLYLVNLKEEGKYSDFYCKFDDSVQQFSLPYNLEILRIKDGKSTDISIDSSYFSGNAIIRFAKEGESIKLQEGTKTVNKLLKDMKVPQIFRNKVPVIADDEGLCVVFASVFGGRDRICVKMKSSLALNNYYKYICHEGIK